MERKPESTTPHGTDGFKITEIAQSMKNHNSKAEWKLVSWRSYEKLWEAPVRDLRNYFRVQSVVSVAAFNPEDADEE